LSDYIFVFIVIITGFYVGSILTRVIKIEAYRDRLIHICVYFSLRFLIPSAMALSIWQLPIDSWLMLVLPIFTVIFLVAGLGLGLLLANGFNLSPHQKGAYSPAGGFTNIGVLGMFCVLVYVGESGVALIPLVKMFEEVVYFSIFFPYAARCAEQESYAPKHKKIDPIIIITMSACFVGLILNISGVERPQSFQYITQLFIPLSSFLLMITIGLSFRLHNFKNNWKPALSLAISKILCLPLIVLGLFYISGLWHADNLLLIQTLFVVSAMPCAFIAIVPASLYKLDVDLASATWGTSTLLFIFSLPLLPWLLSLLG
jgi:predicted permease